MGISIDAKPVYCMHCKNWYFRNKADQCEIPTPSKRFGSPETGYIIVKKNTQYGYPSKLNKNNDCSSYNKINLFGKLGRLIFYGIPLRPKIKKSQPTHQK